ncbi:MAG: radical SAM protein [Polyangiaceae bacterium]|nr:radical SAM protein [Polyangiaceae bacterium]
MKALIDRWGCVPESCVWELTRACNLRCGHCGTAAGRRREHELDTAQAIDVARQLVRLGNRLTTLSGGEPTLREDWPEIARTFVDAGVTVNMVTNGQSGGRELAVRAKEARLANVAVSIDGLAETHDALRGRGAFERATDTIGALVRAGIWVDMMLTVNRRNLTELVGVWELAKRLGAQRFRVQLGKPMGNQTHRDDLTLEPQDLLTLLPLLGRLAARGGPGVRIGDSVGYFSPEERVLRGRFCAQGHWTGCYAGVRAIGIQADGGVKGCLSLQPRAGEADRFVEGNLRHESLEAIWLRPGAFAYNRHFERAQLKGACARCSHAELCRGGATCVAYTYSGEIGCDPMCYYQVAGLSEATRQRVWPLSAPAAAAVLMLSLTSCGGDADNRAQETGGMSSTGGSGDTGGSPPTAGTGGTTTLGTGGNVALDYGVIAPDGGTGGQALPHTGGQGTGGQGTGGQALPHTGGQGTGGQALPHTGGQGTGGQALPHTGGQGTGGAAMDYGVIAPDYGVVAPEAGAGGQGTGGVALDYGVVAPDGGRSAGGTGGITAMPDYGVVTPDYGVITPDYGVVAPEAGAAGAAGAAGVDCSQICCECDYGILQPEEYEKCCT